MRLGKHWRNLGGAGRHFAPRFLVLATLTIVRSKTLTAQQPVLSDSSCLATFDSMVQDVGRNYAGYREKSAGHQAALKALSDSVRRSAKVAQDWGTQCFPALHRWVQFFKDPHMVGPWQAAPPSHQTQPSGPGKSQAPDTSQLPSLRILDSETLVLRLPDLSFSLKATIDSVAGANWGTLTGTPYLIVDVRGNAGGCTCSFDTLMSLLYTSPVRDGGEDVLASPTNVLYWRDVLTRGVLGDSDRILAAIHRMQSHDGQLVELFPPSVSQRKAVLPYPRRVAVLVDHGCASSCEDFVLDALQSTKVMVIGSENTAGVHDYGNIRKAYLPGWRQMMVPTTRMRGPRIDFVGIKPSVMLSPNADAVAIARRLLALKD